MNYGHHKLTRGQIIQIAIDPLPPKALAEDYGVTISMISYIRSGRRHAEKTGIKPGTVQKYKRG